MRWVDLDEEDAELFGQQINRSLYKYYTHHTEDFSQMCEEQCEFFWIALCVNLRSHLHKRGHITGAYLSEDTENAFINILKILTRRKAAEIHSLVKNVVSVSRFNQLMRNISLAVNDPSFPNNRAFISLFGDPKKKGTLIKMCATLPIYQRMAGCLCLILKRWLSAEPMECASRWATPEDWMWRQNKRPSKLETYIKDTWDNQFLLHFELAVDDICWWNEEELCCWEHAVYSNCSKLTHVVRSESHSAREYTLFLTEREEIYAEVVYFHILQQIPSGHQVMFEDEHRKLLYSISTSRVMALDNEAALHPYSQMLIGLWKNAFGNMFWGPVEEKMNSWRKAILQAIRTKKDKVAHNKHLARRREVSDTLKKLQGYVLPFYAIIKKAMEMNSSFHDSLQKDVKWTSPSVLVRLPWNHVLLFTWLNSSLNALLQFESFIIPICYYTLPEIELVDLVHSLHFYVRVGKMMIQSSIIILEELQRQEEKMPDRCYEWRLLIRDAVLKISSIRDFIECDAYRVYNHILASRWDEEEEESPEENSSTKNKVYLNQALLTPDCPIPRIFNQNCRNIWYWLDDVPFPELYPQKSDLELVVKWLKECLEERKYIYETPQNLEGSSVNNYDIPPELSLFEKYSKKLLKQMECPKLLNHKMKFVAHVLELMEDEEVLDPQMHFCFCDTLRKCDRGENGTKGMPESTKKILKYMEQYSYKYLILDAILGTRTAQLENDQSGLIHILLNTCKVERARTAAQLGVALQEFIGTSPSPCDELFFTFDNTFFKNVSEEKRLDKSGPNFPYNLLEQLEKQLIESDGNLLQSVIVKQLDGRDFTDQDLGERISLPAVNKDNYSDILVPWLQNLESRCNFLMMRISDHHFDLCRRTETNGNRLACMPIFPHLDTLEHRFAEEVASLTKWMEIEDKVPRHAMWHMKLLTRRQQWFEEEFKKWKAGNAVPVKKKPAFSFKKMLEVVMNNKLKMMSHTLDLVPLFKVYLSRYTTTHPLSDIAMELYFSIADMLCNFLSVIESEAPPSALQGFVEFIEKSGPEYAGDLLEHCLEAWEVPSYNSDLRQTVSFGSVAHAQQIITTFKKLFLMSLHSIMPECITIMLKEEVSVMCTDIIYVDTIVRGESARQSGQDVNIQYPSWCAAREEIKETLCRICFNLKEFPRLLCNTLPEWLTDQPVWSKHSKLLFSNKYGEILRKISFPEFLAASKIARALQAKRNKARRKMKPAVTIHTIPESAASNEPQKKAELRKCASCKVQEPNPRTYKKCAKCKEASWKNPRFYCGRECQVKDWQERHCVEHQSREG